MTKYIIRRILLALPVVFLMVLATFVLVHAMPGGPFDAIGQRAMPEHIRINLERKYGLDKPLYEQFFSYLFNLLKGDFGPLFREPAQNVNDVIAQTFPVSIQLGLMAVALGLEYAKSATGSGLDR